MPRLDDAGRAPRLPALTGLRIFAALAVYASHIGPPASSPLAMQSFFEAGYSGVTVFFVLSGFVLALNYFEDFRRPTAGGTYRYFVARIARVYPLYLLVVLYIIVRHNALGESMAGWWQHLLAIQAWHPDLLVAYNFDPPGWSIGVEFFLYACFPLIVPLTARLRSPRALLVAAGAIVLAMAALAGWFDFGPNGGYPWDGGSAHRWLYRSPLARLGDFTLGILAARLYLQTRDRGSITRAGPVLAVAAAATLIGLMCWKGLLMTPWSWDLAYAVPAVVCIFGLAVAPLGLLARLLSIPFIVLLGEASYAFYLVHWPALQFLAGGQWAATTTMTTVAYEAFTLGAILALAIGLHLMVERPARTYVKRALGWRRAPKPVARAPRPAPEPPKPVPGAAASEPASP